MLTPEQVEALKNHPEWRALSEHLVDCVGLLDSCSNIPDTTLDFAVAAKARKEAVVIMKKILEPFLEEPAQAVIDQQRKSREKLGLL